MTLPDQINDFLVAASRKEAEVVEEACERAITNGKYGVRVTRTVEMDEDSCRIISEAIVDPSVPYGRIVYESEFR